MAGEFISPRAAVRAVELCAFRLQLILQMYSPQLLDHFRNPRHSGDIADPDALAEIENPACGDILRLTLKASAGQIVQAQFKAKGCVAAIGCGSALTELITGKTFTEAQTLRRDDVITAVGGLPQASTHAAQLALDALTLALSRVPRR